MRGYRCDSCGTVKVAREFSKTWRAPETVCSACREKHLARAQERYREQRERRKAEERAHYEECIRAYHRAVERREQERRQYQAEDLRPRSDTWESRTAGMVRMRRDGLALQEIGNHYGLTRERVRQLLAAVGEPLPLKTTHYRRFFRAIAVAARYERRALNGGTTTPHGERGRYAHGCRCSACTRANRDYMRALRNGRPPNHGASGYTNYACRCPVCTEANRVSGRQRRERRASS